MKIGEIAIVTCVSAGLAISAFMGIDYYKRYSNVKADIKYQIENIISDVDSINSRLDRLYLTQKKLNPEATKQRAVIVPESLLTKKPTPKVGEVHNSTGN